MTADEITRAVCEASGYTEAELRRHDKHGRISATRQVWHWALYQLTKMSYHEVGRYVNRNHATIIYNYRKGSEFRLLPKAYKYENELMKKIFYGD